MIRYPRELTLVAALATFACTSSHQVNAGDGGPSSRRSGGSGGGDAGKKDGFVLEWSVTDGAGLFGGDGGPAPMLSGLSGVKVCVDDMPNIACATTDAKGAFELDGVPGLTSLVLTLDRDDYVPASKSIQTADTDMNVNGSSILMYPTGSLKPPDGVQQAPDTGSVDFFAIGPKDDDPKSFVVLSDVTVALSPAKGQGPYFSDGRGVYDPQATATVGGFGFYLNLPPGEYTLTFTDPKHDCAPVSAPIGGFGVPVPPTSVKFTVLAGYLTEEVGVYCLEQSVIIDPDAG